MLVFICRLFYFGGLIGPSCSPGLFSTDLPEGSGQLAEVHHIKQSSSSFIGNVKKLLCVQEVETIVKASVTSPESGRQIHMVVGISHETPETPECGGAGEGLTTASS